MIGFVRLQERPGEGNLGRMIFSDHDIREAVKVGKIGIEPFDEAMLQPSSYDMHLMDKVRVFDGYETAVIDRRLGRLRRSSAGALRCGPCVA